MIFRPLDPMDSPHVRKLKELGYENLIPLLNERDGAYRILAELPERLPCPGFDDEARSRGRVSISDYFEAWGTCGTFFHQVLSRHHEALDIFRGLYHHMLRCQEALDIGIHKGMPLVWIQECHAALGHPVLAKRYMMLTAIEDAILHSGAVPTDQGVYFRLVWSYGMSEPELKRYSQESATLERAHPTESRYPEWVLQELDQDWMSEFPSSREVARYEITPQYAQMLVDRLGEGTGQVLERLAKYLLGAIPGCRALSRQRSHSTDYDVVCVLEGSDLDFRSDLGRYFVCECKDWADPVDFSAFAKFCRVLDSVKCRFGIIFSRAGITGEGRDRDAALEQIKVYQDRGMVIVVIDEDDLRSIAQGANLIAMLRRKYEKTRLDLAVTGVLTSTPEAVTAGTAPRTQRQRRPAARADSHDSSRWVPESMSPSTHDAPYQAMTTAKMPLKGRSEAR